MRLRISSAIINAVLISLTVSSAVSYDPPTNLLYQRTRMREPPSVNSISTTKASPVNDPNNECSNHVDGLYSYGCKPQYFACSNGAVYHFECPSELVFNDEYSVCDYPAAVKNCAGKYEVSNKDNEVDEEVTQTTRPVYEEKHVYERPTTAPSTTTQVPRTGDVDCSRLADGTYSSGCSSEFTVCSNGFTYNQLCPDGLVFNPTGGYCDYPDNCGEATSYKTTAAYETTTTTTTSAPSTGSSHCADLPDGVHSFGCQEEYIVCQSGRTLTGRCPRGLVFNGNTKRCDYLENCASSTSSYESTTASPSPQVPYSTTSAPVTRECVRDGVFAEGCSSEFVVCSNGIGHRQKCPDGLVFNVDLGLCDYEHNCGTTKPSELYVTTTEPQVTATEEPVQPTYTTSRPYVPPVDTSRTSCINGQRFSTVLCSSSFSECRNGGYVLKTCPTGTLFDSKYGLCMYDVSACRPQKNYDTSATNSAVYATPASAPINVPVSVSKGLCQGGTNYPRGACMSTYLYCRDGLSFDQKECPANHRFDPVNLDCRMPFLISSCYNEGEKVDEPVYINNADHEDIDYVRYGYSDNEVFVRHGRRHDDDSSDSSEEQDSKYLKDDFQGHGPFYPDGVISNPFYKSHKFMKKIPNGRHRHHHRRHRHGSRRNGFDIFGGDEPHFTVVSNPFYAKRGHYVKNVRLPDAFDKKMGRLTDSIYRFFPDSKRSVSEKKLTAVFTRGDNRRRDSFEEDSWELEHDKADKKWSSKVQGSVDVPVKEDAEVSETTTAPIIEALAEQAKIATVDEDDREEEAETSTSIVDDETSTAIVDDETSTTIVDDETSTTIVDDETSTTIVDDETSTTIVDDETSTTIVDEETSTTIVDDETEEQSVVVDEGSGIEDEEVARSKRYAPVNPSAADSSMCGQGSAMQTVAVGHCHHNFILCNENLQAQVAACPVGETFDAVNKVCVELCGRESESTARVQPIDQSQTQREQVSETFQETVSRQEPEWNGEQKQQDSARYQEVVEEVRQEHMHPIQDDDSYDQSENIAPRPAQDVLLTSNQEQASSGPCAARPNGVYSMGCGGSFLTCSNGQSYVTNCPNGLVFDAATAVCNVPEQVAECDGRVQADTGAAPVAGPMIPRPHEYRPVDFVDTFYNSPQSPKANFVQEDSNFNAGSYNAKDVPVVDLFNESENVVNGPSQPSVPINIWNAPQDTVGQTMQPTGEQLPIQRAEPSTCTGRQDGGYRLDCAGTFVICSYGSARIFNCQPGLHFDEASQACVYSSSACQTAAAPADPYRVQNVANVPSQPIVPSNVWNGAQNTVETQNAVNGPQLTVPTNVWSAPGNSAGQTVPETVAVPLPIQRAEPSECVGRQDGGYRLDCAGTFVICSYGSAHVFNCQPGLHFDEASQACVYSSSACQTAAVPADPYRVQNVANAPPQPIVPSNVWNGAENTVETQNAVNGPQLTVHTKVWSAPGNSAGQTVPQTVAVPMPNQRAEPSECVGRQDGGYRLDCAGTFVICSYGSAHVFNCQPGLHFDEASQACVDSSSACQTAAAPTDSYRVQELPIVPSLVSSPVSVPQQQPTHVRDSAQSETYQAGAYRPEIVPTTRSDASSDRVRAQPTFAGQGADNSVNHQSSRPYVPQVTATPPNEVPMSWSSQSVPESDGTIENLRSDAPYNPRFVVAASERPVGVDFVPKSPAAQDQYVNDGTPATVDNEQPGRLIPAVEYKQFDMSASYPSATVKSWPSESVSDQGREIPRSDEPYRPNIVTVPSENSFGGDTVSTSPVQEQSVSEWEEAMDSEQPYRPTFVVVPSSEKSSDGDSLSKTSADEDYMNTNAGSKHIGVPTESEQTERLSPGDKPFHEVASQDETSYAPEVEFTRTDASVIPHRPVMIPSSVASDEGSVPNEGSEVVIATNAPYAPKIEEDSTSEQVFVPSTVDSDDWKTDATQPDFEKHSDMVTESTIPHRPDSQIFESAGRESEVTVPTNDKRHYVSDKDAEVEKFDNKQDKNVYNTNTRVLPIVIVPDVASDESAMNQGTFKSDDLCSGSDVIIGAACAEEFIACLDGRPLRMTCSQGTVFDVASKSCLSNEAIQECSVPARDQNDMSESVTETVDETNESEGEFIEDLTPESTYDEDSVDDEATSLPAVIDDATSSALTTGLPCDPEAHPLFPVAACSITYAVCHEDGFARAVNCSSTQLFDHILYECVPSELCGHSHFKELLAAIEMGEGLTSAREACIRAKSGQKRFLGECRRSYAVCGRRPTIERCPRDHVFSKTKNACVNKKTIGACRAQVNKSTMTEFKKTESTNTAVQTPARAFDGEPGTFCSDREDALYRHPTECSGIVQCLGGRMIDRRSCTSGLVFNEKTKQCDYATDEKCSRASPLAQDATGCDGHEHGAHFEDAHNCSIFYRCVWNRKVRMDCAPGTLFNKDLSVCDWPSAVPDCVDGVRESEEGDENTAEEDHDVAADDDREHDDYDDEQKVDNHDFIEPVVAQDEDKPEVSDDEYKPQISKDEADADVDTEADAYDHA